jgi:hypothetical protein
MFRISDLRKDDRIERKLTIEEYLNLRQKKAQYKLGFCNSGNVILTF